MGWGKYSFVRVEIFMESFTISNLHLTHRELYGTEMLLLFQKWKDTTNHRFDETMSEGILVKRILTELNLPKGAITYLGRGCNGVKRRYSIPHLKEMFQLVPEELLDYDHDQVI